MPWATGTAEEKFKKYLGLASNGKNVDECWEWKKGADSHGYGIFEFASHRNPSRHLKVRAHRFSWKMVHGEIPPGMFICHHCDNPPCVNPSHLFIGTLQDNVRDMVQKGRGNTLRGEDHPRAKLTADVVVQIMSMANSGISSLLIESSTGVPLDSVNDIRYGRCWRSVTGLPKPKKMHEKEPKFVVRYRDDPNGGVWASRSDLPNIEWYEDTEVLALRRMNIWMKRFGYKSVTGELQQIRGTALF